MKPSHKLADIFRTFGPAFRKTHHQHLPLQHLRIMHAIETCRTSQQGGHVYTCDHCGKTIFSYHSCRNRHCPTCQFLPSQQWLDARKQDLLPIPYFHVVFTLPEQLRPLALRNRMRKSTSIIATRQMAIRLGRRHCLPSSSSAASCCTSSQKASSESGITAC